MKRLTLIEALQEVPEHRRAQGTRYRMVPMLTFIVCAMLAGRRGIRPTLEWGRDVGDRFLRKLGLRRVPGHGTLSRFLAALDAEAFERALAAWVSGLLPDRAEALALLALDGKALRGSRDGEVPGAHLISLFDPVLGCVVAQRRVDAKTNEHKAALELIRGLALENKLVTGDAAFAQRDFCSLVLEGGGHYLVTVKDNQPQLKADCEAAFEPPDSPSGGVAPTRNRRDRTDRRQGPRAPRGPHHRGHDPAA